MFTPEETSRYARHIIIPEIGPEGQLRLKNSSILIIGTGGLGSPAAIYLAAAGVGTIGLVDPDKVDISNLQRQILHSDSTIGKSKLDSAAHRLRETNPHININLHHVRFTPDNAMDIARNYDVILDGSDNFPTRFLSNDTAFFLRKPLVHAAIHRFDGQLTVFAPHLGSPCYRCLLPDLPPNDSVPNCAEAGVLGVLPGIIGSMQAMEGIKLMLGIGSPPLGTILVYQALHTSFRSINLPKDPHCRLCGSKPTITSVHNKETTSIQSCTSPTMQTITAKELKTRIESNNLNAILIDVREQDEWNMAHIPQAKLVPLRTLAEYAPNLPKDGNIIIHCKAGMRSAKACEYLSAIGFQNVTNVTGGMDAYLEL